jgi:hypothetical protein
MDVAKAIEGIPTVQSATARGVLFAVPALDQRVFNKATGNIERWDGTQWFTDFGSGLSVGLGVVNVQAAPFFAKGDGVTDDSAAIQAALNTGLSVYVPYTTTGYACHGLTSSTIAQTIFSLSPVKFIKNANGDHFTSTAANFTARYICLRGDAAAPVFTGHGWVTTGDNPLLDLCGSRWCPGRAYKGTGNHQVIWGTSDIFQTTGVLSTDYDIEMGVLGVDTGYHSLKDIYSSQSTGGILINDAGGYTINGGQFGKLYFKNGGASSANGGKTSQARILGNITVELSGAVFSNNQAGVIALAFAAGTSGCSWDASNTLIVGATVSNLGNANNYIERNYSTGSLMQIRHGDDASLATMQANMGSGEYRFPALKIANNKNFVWEKSDGSNGVTAGASVAGDITFNNLVSGTAFAWAVTGTGSGSRHQWSVGGTNRLVVDNSGIRHGSTAAPFSTSGSGSPEGVVTAIVGSFYLRTDGGAATSIYIKESGTGNTGWVAK